MSTPVTPFRLGPIVRALILTAAAIGFLFDTYELLMFPIIGSDSVGELIWVKPDNTSAGTLADLGLTDHADLKRGAPPASPPVRLWSGRMLWVSALCGGVFGLLGGFLVDRFGRKKVMVGSIIIYSFSPVAAAYSTELWQLILFRCTTFIGVCVEMIAAVTWLAELFENKRTRELAIGWTLACASLGGIFVTEVYNAIVATGKTPGALPTIPYLTGHVPENVAWRFTLLTGLIPGALILMIMPFVPESRVWREKKLAGTLRRPRFAELFDHSLIRTTLVTAGLSACAYAAAFGALQMGPLLMAPGLPDIAAKREKVAERKAELGKLQKDMETRNEADKVAGKKKLEPELAKLKADEKAFNQEVKARRGNMQRWQELGGLSGRILFAALLIFVPSRLLLRLFLVPGVIIFPLTYFVLVKGDYSIFAVAVFFCGLLTVAQMSYMSEYLPKVFPVHLRGTGGGFASNVGARMIGTMAATLNTEVLSKLFMPAKPSPVEGAMGVATAAAIIGGAAFAIALIFSFLLPPPRTEEPTTPAAIGPDA
ncbi:MAG TPA: MFS transporter, partial [Gemmataceae bacterium]